MISCTQSEEAKLGRSLNNSSNRVEKKYKIIQV